MRDKSAAEYHCTQCGYERRERAVPGHDICLPCYSCMREDLRPGWDEVRKHLKPRFQ